MIAAEEIIGPRRGLVQGPVTGWDIAVLKGALLSVGFKAVISTIIDASSLPGKDLAPAI
jgi:hypothetical protein